MKKWTYSAHEAVRVELTVERWNVVLHDCAVASSTLGCEHVEIVIAAIRFSIAFMEAIVAELLTTLGAEEVFSMPGLIQGSHTFLKWKKKVNRLVSELYGKPFRINLHPKSDRCSKHNVDWRDYDNQLRSKDCRHVRRSCACPIPDCSDCK